MDMTATSTAAAMMITTTGNRVRSVRHRIAGLLVTCSLLLTPYVSALAEDQPHQSSIAAQARTFGAAVKHDAKAVGEGCKQIAHRIGVAGKAVGHEIAAAAKRGAAETRAAFRDDNSKAT